ncbi:MAG: hypothetical protein R6U26_01615 [Candidatus Undinarchaeales archaeon]
MSKTKKNNKSEKKRHLRELFFSMKPGMMLSIFVGVLLFIVALLVKKFYTGGNSGSAGFIFMLITFLLIFFNGWGMTHKNGIDFSTVFFYVLVVVFGAVPGLIITVIGTVLIFAIGNKDSPFSFLLIKSFIGKTAELLMLLVIILLVVVISFTGLVPLITLNGFVVVLLISRAIRITFFVLYGRAPVIKVLVSNGTAIIINYYIAKFFLTGILNYANSFV